MTVEFLSGVVSAPNGSDASVTVPASGVPVGAFALAAWSSGMTAAVVAVPPTGWAALTSRVATQSQASQIFYKVLTADDMGDTFVFDSDATGKNTVICAFYTGVDPESPIAGFADLLGYTNVTSTTRLSPAYSAVEKAIEIAISKGTAPGLWTPPAGFTARVSDPGASSGALTLMIADSTTDLDGGNTWSLAAGWPQAAVGAVWLNEGETPPPEPGTPRFIWTGGQTHSTGEVVTPLVGATSVRMAYSTSPDMSSPSYVGAQVPDEFGIVRHTLTGLSPDTLYWVQPADTPTGGEETLVGEPARLHTLQTPGVPVAAREIGIGGCVQTLTSIGTLALVAAVSAQHHYGFLNGDTFYNGSDGDLAAWVNKYLTQISNVPNYAEFVASGMASFALRSDHDTTNVDNGDTPAWVATEVAAWKLVVPQPGVAATDCLDYIKDDGRFSFFVTDNRSVYRSPGLDPDGPSKTMLGADQLSRLIDWIDTTEADFNVIVTDPAWMGPSSAMAAKPDAWWSYAYERQIIIDAINARVGVHFEVWHGDSHLIGYATPEDNEYGGFPVLCAAPYSQDGGGQQTGQFTEFFNNGSADAQEYGRISFTDDGTTITRTYRGYDAISDSVKMTFVTTVDTEPPAGPAVAVWDGASEVPATVTVWTGSAEVSATVEIAS